MKVAIFHDYFHVIGGGEKLILTLARHLGADVITTDLDRTLISKMGFDDVNIISLGSLVRMPPLRQIQATLKYAYCDFRGKYDFYIFSGNWAHYASRKHKPNLMYCHTPVRVFYDLRDQLLESKKGNPFIRFAIAVWIKVHSYFDKRSIKRVEKIVVNSRNTANRVKKYLGRDSMVIYPPCDTSRFKYISDDGYWLSVNRLYAEKRVHVQVGAFARMPEERLVIVGNNGQGDNSDPYGRMVRSGLPHNVSILSDVTEEKLIDLYGRCRGFITTAMDEDFGMTVVEAMASGKPVIAVREGGYLESLVDGSTGIFIDCNEDSIISAVKQISQDPKKYHDACIARSKKFDVSVFLSGMDAIIGKQ